MVREGFRQQIFIFHGIFHGGVPPIFPQYFATFWRVTKLRRLRNILKVKVDFVSLKGGIMIGEIYIDLKNI